MTNNVQDILDRAPLRFTQAKVICLVALILIVEGFDIQLAAFAAPSMTREWGLDVAAMGPTLAAVMVGMAFGGIFGGTLGDRWGRRPVLIAAIVIFGISTCLGAFVSELWQLAALRLIAGLGFGAAYPNATVLVGEWAPLSVRAKAIALLTLGLPIGGLIGAAISSILIPWLGWRLTFLFAGALPLLIAVVMIFALPESLVFRARNPSEHERIRGTLAALSGGAMRETDIVFSHAATQSAGEAEAAKDSIFAKANRRVTLGFWIAFFSTFTVAYMVINWLPSLLTMLGIDEANAIRGSFYMNMAGIAGLFLSAFAYPRFGSRRTLLIMTLVPATAILVAGLSTIMGTDAPLPASFMVLIGICIAFCGVSGATAALWSLSVHAYSVANRTTGFGWANGVGRIGGISSTLIGGALILIQPSPFIFLAFIALMLVVEAIGVLVIDRHAPPIARSESAAAEVRAATG